MDEYVKVNVLDYVNLGIKDGTLKPFQAEKFTRIIAIKGYVGESVISWTTDGNGNEIQEKVATIQMDPQTNQTDWIATKANEQGNAIIDINGHINQWIISDTTFKKKYEIDPENPTLFKPIGGPQTFVQIPDNIILNQWGSEMKIAAGGFINITDENDMYGISQKDFEDTYKPVDSAKKQQNPIKNKVLRQF